MKKKGQLAVETLLIYGVAILVVMLAIGALISFGVLDLGSLLPDSCQLGDLTCENYQVSPNMVQLELRNNLGKNIDSVFINITGERDYSGLWQGCNATYTPSPVLVEGELTRPQISIPCTVAIPSGKKIQGVIIAQVHFVDSQITKTLKGSIRATVS